MSISTWLDRPNANQIVEGKFTLHRIWVLADSVAAPLTPVNVEGIQNINASPLTPNNTRDIMQQGAGEEFYEYKSDYRYDVTVQMLAGSVRAFIGEIYGLTLGSGGTYALPARTDPYPKIILESIARLKDGTHLLTKVYQDLILREWNFNSPMEEEIVDIPFYSAHDPFTLHAGAEMVVDKFTGDGSTTGFSLSSSPLNLVSNTAVQNEDWFFDNAVYVRQKQTTDAFGARLTSGVTIVDTDVTFTTAPANNDVITIPYAKATS